MSRLRKSLIAALLIGVTATCEAKPPTAPDAPAPPAPPAASGVAPSITAQPTAQTVVEGQNAALTVSAAGDAPLAFQWYAGASGVATSPVAGATSASYTTDGLTISTSYWVRVSNGAGVANSETATITVTPAPVAPVLPDPSVLAFEDEALALINQQRSAGAVCGGTAFPPAAALAMQGQLRTAARAHSEDMAAQGYFSHTSLDGRTYSQRIQNAGYFGSPTAENVAAGYATAQAVVTGWMASAGHCVNIMSGSYRSIGVGYAFRSGSPYGHYWTLDFGG